MLSYTMNRGIILFGNLDGRMAFLANFKKKYLVYEDTNNKKNTLLTDELFNSFYEWFVFTKNFDQIKGNIKYIISCNNLYEVPILLRLNAELHYFREDFICKNPNIMDLKHKRFQGS